MTWVSWRLQRTETLIAAAILALIAVLLVPTGIEMANAYHHDGLSACLTQTSSDGCSQAVEGFTQRFQGLGSLLGWLTLVPGLIGVLLAAPFVLELENGTYRLAWTQSVTRRRWIATKLGVAVGAALISRARAHPAHDLVAHTARPPPRPTRRQRIRLRRHRRLRLHAIRARARPRRRRRLAPHGPRGRRRVRRLLRRADPRRHLATPTLRQPAHSHLARRRPRNPRAVSRPRRPRASTTPG